MHPPALVIVLVLALIPAGLLLVALELLRRRIANQREAVNYDPTQDQLFAPQAAAARSVTVELGSDAFLWPAPSGEWGTAWLELPVRTNFLGRLLDPFLECRCEGVVLRQYVERGAAGKRWFNLTRLLGHPAVAGRPVQLIGRHLHWTARSARLLLLPAAPPAPGPILVLAPHPDDAEIAAFGLYSARPSSWIVTITLGDNGPSQYAQFFATQAAAYAEKARLRAWDSLSIPRLGDIPVAQIANLGYFDGTLEKMYAAPDTPVEALLTGQRDLALLRCNPLDAQHKPTDATWRNLVADLRRLIAHVRPAAIVLPHPQLDPHSDHQFTAIAAIEALEDLQQRSAALQGKLLLYSNHALGTELYPFGANDGVMSIPPMHDTHAYFESVWCVPLDARTRLRKQIALQAHHDLQPAPPNGSPRLRNVIREALRIPYVHLVGADNDYVRRAARANELFFVVDYARAGRLRDEFLAQARRRPA